jgi:hypothetical protein
VRVEELRVVGLVSGELVSGVLGHANLGWSYSRSAKKSTTQWWLGVETTSDLSVAADVFGDDRGRPGSRPASAISLATASAPT